MTFTIFTCFQTIELTLKKSILFAGKCRSRSLLLEKPLFLYQPFAHSSKTNKVETLENNGNVAMESIPQ